MNKLLFAFIFVAMLFPACNSADKYATEIKQLDSLSILLDSAQLKLATIDTVVIQAAIEELTLNLDFIEKNNRDTVNRETAFLLSDYSLLREPLKKINTWQAELKEELKTSKEQIQNLIHDFKTGTVEEEKASCYMNDERIAANRVIQGTEMLLNSSKVNIEKLEAGTPGVLEFIEKIKIKQ